MKLNNRQLGASYLAPDWPNTCSAKPGNIQACTTLITGGNSKGDYSQFNLASHVGDDVQAVRANRAKLVEDLKLPSEPAWLEQVHSNRVLIADDMAGSSASGDEDSAPAIQADASIARTKGVVCAVLTADCLPVFFCNRYGTEVAVAHAGWRGLHAGIISNTVNTMSSLAGDILVSLGPAIGARVFEVGDEVFQAFVDKDSKNQSAFVKAENNRYLCDIYKLATIELQSVGVTQVAGGRCCTYSESNRFYSYRRRQITGRMASIIWIS